MTRWYRNESSASARTCVVYITLDDGVSPIPGSFTGTLSIRTGDGTYGAAGGTLTQIGTAGVSTEWRYVATQAETNVTSNEVIVQVSGSGLATRQTTIDIVDAPATAASILDAARSAHVTVGTIGEGIALAAALLQGNFYMDQVTVGANGLTAARIRCFHTGSAAAAATSGGSGEGEFATFLVSTTYTSGHIATHRSAQQ